MVKFSNQSESAPTTRHERGAASTRTFAVGHIRHGRKRLIVAPKNTSFAFPGPWEVRAVVLVS